MLFFIDISQDSNIISFMADADQKQLEVTYLREKYIIIRCDESNITRGILIIKFLLKIF